MKPNIEKLIVDTSNEKQFEIVIEFPLSVLGGYNDISNLDETWDDNIMPIIHESLLTEGVNINKSELQILSETKTYEEKLSYRILILTNLSSVDLNCIVDNLTKENFQRGLCIKKATSDLRFMTLYYDVYYTDRPLD